MAKQWNQFAIVLLLATLFLSSCIYPLTMHSREGEKLDGQWSFGQGGGGSIQVFASDGEVLIGRLEPVARRLFFDNYEKFSVPAQSTPKDPTYPPMVTACGVRLGARMRCWIPYTAKASIPRPDNLNAPYPARYFTGLQSSKATNSPSCNVS